METGRRKFMNWIGDKMFLIYAIGALLAVGLIWIVGEIRLYLRTRHCKPKKEKKNS